MTTPEIQTDVDTVSQIVQSLRQDVETVNSARRSSVSSGELARLMSSPELWSDVAETAAFRRAASGKAQDVGVGLVRSAESLGGWAASVLQVLKDSSEVTEESATAFRVIEADVDSVVGASRSATGKEPGKVASAMDQNAGSGSERAAQVGKHS